MSVNEALLRCELQPGATNRKTLSVGCSCTDPIWLCSLSPSKSKLPKEAQVPRSRLLSAGLPRPPACSVWTQLPPFQAAVRGRGVRGLGPVPGGSSPGATSSPSPPGNVTGSLCSQRLSRTRQTMQRGLTPSPKPST